MAKKKKNNFINTYSVFAILLLTVATVCMMFLCSVNYVGKIAGSQIQVTGLQAIFGWSSENLVFSSFNIMILLTYLLSIGGLVLSLMFKKGGMLINLIILACFVVSAVFFFITPSFMVLTDAGKLATAIHTATLGVGSIIAGIFSIINALIITAKILLK